MARMRTFLLYALGIIGFMFLSYVLENGLIQNMYKEMNGGIEQNQPISSDIQIQDVNARASSVNGYMQFKLKNDSPNSANGNYIKIDLYSKQGLLAATKYVKITDLEPGKSKEYNVNFKGTQITDYKVAVVPEAPDKTNIINILGWEIDLSDVFGLDLTNVKIFGVKLTELFNWDNAKTTGANIWNWAVTFASSIPWWGYAIASGIIIWYMPSGYLFGIFPF